MGIFYLLLSVVLTWFSCTVLAYVSMATMIGPWIAPALVLIISAVMKLARQKVGGSDSHKTIALLQTVGSVGGLVATSVGFTLPTLYFLDASLFNEWMAQPFYFCLLLGGACISAGGFGIWLARVFSNKMILEEDLQFPVSNLISETITVSAAGGEKIWQLVKGFFVTWILCFFRDGIQVGSWLKIGKLIPSRSFFLFPEWLGKNLPFSIIPMFWAVGYIAGPGIVMPLLIGLLSKYLVVWPFITYAGRLPFELFSPTSVGNFTMALCAGLAVSEAASGILKWPGLIAGGARSLFNPNIIERIRNFKFVRSREKKSHFSIKEATFAIALAFGFLSYCQFSIPAQLFIVLGTAFSSYHISYLGAKIGLVFFGRFATFVMLPSLFMFDLSSFQITMLCVFVVISCAAASDLLFDYKIGHTFGISFDRVHRYQWLGLLATAIGIGACFWLFFTNLQLGSSELFAQRCQNRALLIQSINFDWRVILIGVGYGFLLRRMRVSPTMVFGGLLMPNSLTFGLVLGAIGTYLSKDPKENFPFFSGIFASESIWIITRILLAVV
jgi:hypothetical protein